jgi:murein DD-endopeptidase MepM/ murein hydrolase activator NlpD
VSVLTCVLVALAGTPSAAHDIKPPQIAVAEIDWSSALATLAEVEVLRSAALGADGGPVADTSVPPVLSRLNAAMAQRFAGAAASPLPVLLPFDTEALLREQSAGTAAEDNDRYLSGFHARKFFFAGPSGYDAALAVRTAEVPELADIKFADPIDVHISGSALIYQLDPPAAASLGTPVPALETEFPGIRRIMYEHHLRYTFVRYGAPYVVSIGCFDASVSRYRLPTCRAADRIVVRLLRALRIVGGTPQPMQTLAPAAIERPENVSASFTYHSPGRLLTGTSFRGAGGRPDSTVYSQIRFPLAEAPAFANTQMFASRNPAPNYGYPWRDNFCERRGFPVGQCPAGHGHQGQDIRPTRCETVAQGHDGCRHELVAVRDGAILRAPRQEAAYLVVNTAGEHIRFRYLHMSPRRMDEDNLLSGRMVREGEVIGKVSNYSRKEAGTSYHLHFDVQVPTREGWVFVNPYITLVAAYERLIGARGQEITDPTLLASIDSATTQRADQERAKRSRHAKRIKGKPGKYAKHPKHKKQRLARR